MYIGETYEDDQKKIIKILSLDEKAGLVSYSIDGKGFHTVRIETIEGAIKGNNPKSHYRLKYIRL